MTEPTSAPPGPSGEFSLDLELAAEAVRDLEGVRQQLTGLRYRAAELGRTALAAPTAQDAVSMEAFAFLAQKADGVPGSLGLALDAGIIHVQGLIDQMNADIDAQRREDDVAKSTFRSA